MSSHRATIFLSEAEILAHEAFPGHQYILRVRAPEAAKKARPGTFAHIAAAGARANGIAERGAPSAKIEFSKPASLTPAWTNR